MSQASESSIRAHLSDALPITGWMTVDELNWLAFQASTRRVIVEFGSWCGRSSIALACGSQLLCVDTWADYPKHRHNIKSGRTSREEFLHNTAKFPNVTSHQGDLSDDKTKAAVARIVAGMGGADMVFIDATHEYEPVKGDISLAREIMNPGGLLCGHDYGADWPGLVAAVHECVANVSTFESIWHETRTAGIRPEA